VPVLPPEDPNAGLAAFTVAGAAPAIWKAIEADLKEDGVTDMTSQYGPRLVEMERCAYLRPVIVHCKSPANAIAKKEYMFPFATVVECPQAKMLESIGPTLVCTAITEDPAFQRQLTDATHIDRLNIGPIPTIKLDWLQPHEGNIVDFLFRARAYQLPKERLAVAR
jgi:acyl-CoA reductase-like NAD-dependent aldehyde dehydrogenase